MSDPFIGEIRMFPFNFAPNGWAFADGQLLPIQQNQALFSLLGTQFGGDGFQSFALPDLRGRVAVHQGLGTAGTTYVVGQAGGAESVILSNAQMPNHTHQLAASSLQGTLHSPGGAVLAATHVNMYAPAPNETAMSEAAIGHAGSSQPITVLPPYLTVSFCIALFGIFPSRS